MDSLHNVFLLSSLKKTKMKNKILIYIVATITTFSLQSCVSNYVVSATPSSTQFQSKPNANLPKISKASLNSAKQSIYSEAVEYDKNFEAAKLALAEVNKLETKATIEKTVKLNQTIDNILEHANSYLGTPYRYGGMSRSGIDCSAFVLSVFNEATGLNLPRVAAAQAHEGEQISRSELQKGDLLFFSNRSRISHVGIVYDITEDGDILFIHAATSKGVSITSLNKSSYWSPRFRFAKRIITDENI